MKKRLWIAALTAACLLTAACGTNPAAASSDDSTQIANPWSDTTEEEAKEMIPDLFHVPDGASDLHWSVMQEAESGPLVQLTFELYDLSFTERAQVTNDASADISGMYYEWTVSEDAYTSAWGDGSLTGRSCRYLGEDETVDLLTWYNGGTGTSFSLSTSAPDLDGFDIQAVAEASY